MRRPLNTLELKFKLVMEKRCKHLYASTSKDREQWIRALKVQPIQSFSIEFDIVQQIGAGRFSKVYRCVKKQEIVSLCRKSDDKRFDE